MNEQTARRWSLNANQMALKCGKQLSSDWARVSPILDAFNFLDLMSQMDPNENAHVHEIKIWVYKKDITAAVQISLVF